MEFTVVPKMCSGPSPLHEHQRLSLVLSESPRVCWEHTVSLLPSLCPTYPHFPPEKQVKSSDAKSLTSLCTAAELNLGVLGEVKNDGFIARQRRTQWAHTSKYRVSPTWRGYEKFYSNSSKRA